MMRPLAALALLVPLGGVLCSEERATAPTPPAQELPSLSSTDLPSEVIYQSSPQVRIDVLMVAVPPERALALLPQLRDPARVENAQATLLEDIASHQARLVDWPEITLHSGFKFAESATYHEALTASTDAPSGDVCGMSAGTSVKPPPPTPEEEALYLLRFTGLFPPRSFWTRNTGTTLQAATAVAPDAKSIQVVLSAEYVAALPEFQHVVAKPAQGPPVILSSPRFFTAKAYCSSILRDGERRLIYVHGCEEGNEVLLFVAGAHIVPPFTKPTRP